MKTNLQDYIAIYKAIEPSICKQIINDSNEAQWSKHSYHDPITLQQTTYKDDLDITYENKYKNYLYNIVKDCVCDYIKNIPLTSFPLKDISDIRFNRYEIGTNMKPHCDHIHSLFDGEKKGIPILTILALLNDDFEGGDFLIFNDKKVQLETGDIIIFPSNFLYPHAVTTVTKGTRYSFVSWGF